ncbi:MAG TPA: hypothetical protein VFF98_14215, partial [Novosphingobium sp.]|nr:hypothetical protein [Novosphingobium sp.]
MPWLAAALLPAPAAWAGSAAARPPAAAAAAGFLQKTFETGPFSADNVDLANSGKKGFNWYFWNSFGCTATAADAHLAIGDDGALTLGGACGNGSLVSGAARPSDPQRFVGQAFGGGGYFEAEIRIDTTRPQQGHGWPSWWLLSAEHMWYLPQNYWPGQTNGYEHFLEIDAFEAMRPAGRADAYMATVHDWYGTFHKTCPPKAAFCQIITPYHDNIVAPARPIDWSRWHRIA